MQEKSKLEKFNLKDRSPHSRRTSSNTLVRKLVTSPKIMAPNLIEKVCSPYAIPQNSRLKKKSPRASQRSQSPAILIQEINLPGLLTPKPQNISNFVIGDNLSPRSSLNPSDRQTIRRSETMKNLRFPVSFSAHPSPKRSDSAIEK